MCLWGAYSLWASLGAAFIFLSAPSTFAGGIHVPIINLDSSSLKTRSLGVGAIGLGDFKDVSYNVLVKIGVVTLPVILDTGSADLWILLDSCQVNCSHSLPVYPHKSLKYSGVDARLFYGDSTTGTYAFGPIGKDTVAVANLSMPNQCFAGINQTDTNVATMNSVGIFGLGFPVNSVIWNALFNHQYPSGMMTSSNRPSSTTSQSPRSSSLAKRGKYNELLHPRKVSPDIAFEFMQSLATVDQLLSTFITNGPLIARMAFSGLLLEPSFSVTLQRDSLDIGGNIGLLSMGGLPDSSFTGINGVDTRNLSNPSQNIGSTQGRSWEVPITNVYLDGELLPKSTLSTGVSLSALIDTGSSLIRGPSDVVSFIYGRISGSSESMQKLSHDIRFNCLGSGQRFPVDPRDFGRQAANNDIQTCNSSIGFLYAWSLGAPFLKSVLASFYYGNLTHPSVDPPRMGFVSTVPPNSKDLFAAAIKTAHNNFPGPPPQSVPNTTLTGIAGVALAPTLSSTGPTTVFSIVSSPSPSYTLSLSPSQFTSTNNFHNSALRTTPNIACVITIGSILAHIYI
ncbi:aspartic peptidase domain-containing protein [Cantharellus anzutake]|uniref:aspartic peptidase domain-containing protein n=1 Tax=Cantharellus anzutake TaxID=1750568 RepID=UPI0019050CD3|nr:aspartic peptidase domain-containing protein [Cantharellus anzutake]KAF8328165.1 aspartic peptidase domain-containing protein [Cantharellus anzutake]